MSSRKTDIHKISSTRTSIFNTSSYDHQSSPLSHLLKFRVYSLIVYIHLRTPFLWHLNTVGECVHIPRLLKRRGWNILHSIFSCSIVHATSRCRPSLRCASPKDDANLPMDGSSPTRDDANLPMDGSSPSRRPRRRVLGLLQPIRTTTLPLRTQ